MFFQRINIRLTYLVTIFLNKKIKLPGENNFQAIDKVYILNTFLLEITLAFKLKHYTKIKGMLETSKQFIHVNVKKKHYEDIPLNTDANK